MQNGDAGPSDNGVAILVMGVLDMVADCTFNNNHAAVGGAITVEANATMNTVNNTILGPRVSCGNFLGETPQFCLLERLFVMRNWVREHAGNCEIGRFPHRVETL